MVMVSNLCGVTTSLKTLSSTVYVGVLMLATIALDLWVVNLCIFGYVVGGAIFQVVML